MSDIRSIKMISNAYQTNIQVFNIVNILVGPLATPGPYRHCSRYHMFLQSLSVFTFALSLLPEM